MKTPKRVKLYVNIYADRIGIGHPSRAAANESQNYMAFTSLGNRQRVARVVELRKGEFVVSEEALVEAFDTLEDTNGWRANARALGHLRAALRKVGKR